MYIEFFIKGFEKSCLVIEPYLNQLTVQSGLSPSEQIDYVEKNPESHEVRYAILFDDEDNVEKMFVRDLQFQD